MTTAEFSLEFDILYNNIKSQSAPGLDEYEKSVFLTQAELLYVLQLVHSTELTEKERRILEKLVKQEVLTTKDTSNSSGAKISTDSVFYTLPSSALEIKFEELNIIDDTVTKDINIQPIKLDEYLIQKNNPFKKPKSYGLNSVAWRLDYGGETNSTIEIVPPNGVTVNSYKVRYIKKPAGIILVDLTTIASGLTINGNTAAATCQLNSSCHLEILNIAVNLAKNSYYSKQ